MNKHIISYRNFLNEDESPNIIRTEDIDRLKFWELYKSNCKTHSLSKETPIYRGMDSTIKYGLFDPKKSKELRKSAYAAFNYYTLLLDNLSSWSAYPKRAESAICTTDFSKAKKYGEPFIVIPFDNVKVAVCNDEDIWTSFRNLPNQPFGDLEDLTEFFDSIRYYLNHYYDTNFAKDSDKEWSKFSEILTKMDEIDWNKFKTEDYEHNEELAEKFNEKFTFGMIDVFEKGKKERWIDFLNIFLDPKANSFQLIDYNGNFNLGTTSVNKEVWLSGESLLLHFDTYEKIKSGLNQ